MSQREHGRAELARKLARTARNQVGDAAAEADVDRSATLATDPASEVQQVLDELQSRGWLDERRAVESLIAGKSRQWGAGRLAGLLRARELPEHLIDEALQALRSSETERAYAVWQRRYGAPPQDLRERARQQRFLAARGFDASAIDQVFRRIREAGPGDIPVEPAD